MLWAVLITYGLIGCSDRRFVMFPVGLVHQRLIDLKGGSGIKLPQVTSILGVRATIF